MCNSVYVKQLIFTVYFVNVTGKLGLVHPMGLDTAINNSAPVAVPSIPGGGVSCLTAFLTLYLFPIPLSLFPPSPSPLPP